MKKKQILIRLHPNKHKELKILAAKEERSVNYIVELAISMITANPEKFLFKDNNEEFKNFIKRI